MRCPYCHVVEDRVLETRSTDDGYSVRRRRVCMNCGKKFQTTERIEKLALRVVKGDQDREPFEREKIRRGIERACSKRPVDSRGIESLLQKIEAEIFERFEGEVPAERIGEIVMRHLADVDEVAYIRFASVYREFENAEDFAAAIRKM